MQEGRHKTKSDHAAAGGKDSAGNTAKMVPDSPQVPQKYADRTDQLWVQSPPKTCSETLVPAMENLRGPDLLGAAIDLKGRVTSPHDAL